MFSYLDGVPRLVTMLLYGSGARLLEGLGLRVKDVDFGRGEILIRDGKAPRVVIQTRVCKRARHP